MIAPELVRPAEDHRRRLARGQKIRSSFIDRRAGDARNFLILTRRLFHLRFTIFRCGTFTDEARARREAVKFLCHFAAID